MDSSPLNVAIGSRELPEPMHLMKGTRAMRWLLAAQLLTVLLEPSGFADEPDKKERKDGPLVLRLLTKKTTFVWNGAGKTPAQFKKHLEELAQAVKDGRPILPPAPPDVNFTLQITNSSKEAVTVHVDGDPNVYTLELKGPGVFALPNPAPRTLDFRLPRTVTLEPGKSHEVPLRSLMDGDRGKGRFVYWTEPGAYTLRVSYQLTDRRGQKTGLLRSEPVNLKVQAVK
jgi:hypothetical protein